MARTPTSSTHPPEPLRQRVVRWTRNALIISIAVHAVFLVVSGAIVAFRMVHKPDAIFEGEPPVNPKLEPRKLEMKVRVQDMQKRSARPRLQPRLVAMSPTDLAMPEIKVDPKAVTRKAKREYARVGVSGFGTGIGGGLGDGMGGGMGLPGLMMARCNKQMRSMRLSENGGNEDCEKAVVNALRWLKSNQNSDGSWGNTHKTAMTGFALLAFLAHCETPESVEFGQTVTKAINYLVEVGGRGGRLMAGGGDVAYQHGIATYALGEAYTMTRMAKIAPVLEKAAEIIIRGQTPPGGWMYGYGGDHTDGSVMGWQIQALKSVHVSGLKVKGLEECLDKAIDNIKKLQGANGGFPYRAGGGGGWGLAGVGVLGLQMWKNPSSKEVRLGVEFIVEHQKELDYEKSAPLYSWYYNTYACFMRGGSSWRKWNRMFRNELLKNQNADGSWKPEGGGQAASHAGGDADVYRTCLCTLMLEVYYRFLPTT